MARRWGLIGARGSLGALALTAIAVQLAVHVQPGFSIGNFCSYYTNLSNGLAAGVPLPGVLGVVFALLLRDAELGQLRPWVNVVLHYVMPVGVVLDWLALPALARLTAADLGRCLVVPLAYLGYVLARGARTGWYPYPFLDPARSGGYGRVGLYAAAIAACCLLLASILYSLANRRRSHSRDGWPGRPQAPPAAASRVSDRSAD